MGIGMVEGVALGLWRSASVMDIGVCVRGWGVGHGGCWVVESMVGLWKSMIGLWESVVGLWDAMAEWYILSWNDFVSLVIIWSCFAFSFVKQPAWTEFGFSQDLVPSPISPTQSASCCCCFWNQCNLALRTSQIVGSTSWPTRIHLPYRIFCCSGQVYANPTRSKHWSPMAEREGDL